MEEITTFENLSLIDYRAFRDAIVYREMTLVGEEYINRDIRIYGVEYINTIPHFEKKTIQLSFKEGKLKNVYTFTCGKKKYTIVGTQHEISHNKLGMGDSGLKTLPYFDQSETINIMMNQMEKLNLELEKYKNKADEDRV
ncbi:hypothetical protein [Bernardetia sp. MNP-M8]|uniref:hypothetical protein n=1 Tax=Bernardetia sp. MNP-M8 TaxID=3127470 RepID=UPI0030D15D0C